MKVLQEKNFLPGLGISQGPWFKASTLSTKPLLHSIAAVFQLATTACSRLWCRLLIIDCDSTAILQVCTKVFHEAGNMKRHILYVHNATTVERHQCQHCDRDFSTKNNLIQVKSLSSANIILTLLKIPVLCASMVQKLAY